MREKRSLIPMVENPLKIIYICLPAISVIIFRACRTTLPLKKKSTFSKYIDIINIPCLVSDHPFQILRNVIVNDPSMSLTQNNMILKDFSMDEIISGLEKIPLGCSRMERNRIIEETASKVIQNTLKYGIIIRKEGDKNRFHLLCKGNRRSVIDRELLEKYVRNWSGYKADLRARKRVEEEYRKNTKLDEN